MLAESTHLFQDTMPEQADWVIVIGDVDARIYFRKDGEVLFYKNLFTSETVDEEVKPAARVVQGADGRRYRTIAAPATAQRRSRRFVSEACEYLNRMAGKSFSRLMIVAGPATMAAVKACISPHLQSYIHAIAERDIGQLSARQLEGEVLSLFPAKTA